MDKFWLRLLDPASAISVIWLVSLVFLYLVIRLAVMHALRDHARWTEKARLKSTRRTYPDTQRFPPSTPDTQRFPPITPEGSEPF